MVQQQLFPIDEKQKAHPKGEHTINKISKTSKSQTRKIKKHYKARVEVFYFQPFPERALLFPGSQVVGLNCGGFDYYLVKFLKGVLAHYKAQAVDTARLIKNAGGWLPGSKCWFIEINVWPEIKQVLIAANIEIKEVKQNEK